MSSTHTDPIFVSPSAQISFLLTWIASRMFENFLRQHFDPNDPEPLMDESMFLAWQRIRNMAHLYASAEIPPLDGLFEKELFDAIGLAHIAYHARSMDRGPVGTCECEMSVKIDQIRVQMIRVKRWGKECQQ